MITEVDDALCVLLGRSLPEGTMVRLDPPKPTWQTERPSKAIDLFLFGLHDDERARESGWSEVRDARGAVVSRQESVRRCELSYLVTARAPKISEEHRLLDIALRTMVFTDTLPADCLPEELAHAGAPVFVNVAHTDPGGLWTSLGMPARAAFVVRISAPFVPEPETDLAPPAEKITLNAGQRVRSPGPLAPAGPKKWVRTPPNGQVTPANGEAPLPAPDGVTSGGGT
ncbi:MAG TPA: Pvc16 family protein [Actinophytocola sp.]|uniref:Pvc16 family protein n=1 Tax=Actinophytocola sp. TaxID=1872138 RepID=UPI002DDCCCF5|nr:Pvc16 family protein [Actinophytocola sp.]HEV2778576.1 Pvc16 family protein [Actinophytocola sp.]